jgi:hypothetical protein
MRGVHDAWAANKPYFQAKNARELRLS